MRWRELQIKYANLLAFIESVDSHFEGIECHVIWGKNGNSSYDDICVAIKGAKSFTDKPTLMKVFS